MHYSAKCSLAIACRLSVGLSVTLVDCDHVGWNSSEIISRPPSWKISNGRICATGDPIHFMFGSMVGFSGSADRMALFPVTSNPSWQQAAILDNFEWPHLRNSSFDPLI